MDGATQVHQIISYIGTQLKDTTIERIEFNTAILMDSYERNFVDEERIMVDIFVDKLPKIKYELLCILDNMFPQFVFCFREEEK